jgi:hypothetical protein
MLKESLKARNNENKHFKKKGRILHRQKALPREIEPSPYFESENNLEMSQFKDLEQIPSLSPITRQGFKRFSKRFEDPLIKKPNYPFKKLHSNLDPDIKKLQT